MHESCTFLMFLYKKNTGLLTILPESCTFLMFLSNFSILSKCRKKPVYMIILITLYDRC